MLAVALLAALAACVGRPPATGLVIGLSSPIEGRCGITVDGVTVDRFADPALERVLRPHRGEPVHIIGGAEVPYRCIGGLIDTMQTMGFRRVAFTAEPPAP